MDAESELRMTTGASSSDAHGPLLDAAFEAMESAIVVCDHEGRLVLANAAARALWALGPDAGAAGSVRDVQWFADRSGGLDPLSEVLSGQGTVRSRRSLPGTSERAVAVEAAAVQGPAGELAGAVMTVRGVELESEADEQLHGFASDLLMLAEVSRLLAEISDPDEAAGMICTVAMGATGAVAMMLWRLVDGELELGQHEAVIAIGDDALTGGPARPGAMRALAAGKTEIERMGLAPDGMTLIETDEAGAVEGADANAFTAWHEPLVSGGQVIGVLTIVFPGVIDDLSRPTALISSLAQHSAAAIDRSELLRQLAQAARTDPLTGVANRRTWTERLDQELLRANRTQQPLSLIMIDIDHFKRFNDTRGHSEGDRLLREAATAWSRRIRRTDLLARIGGEEFAVLLPDCAAENLPAVAEALREAMPEDQTCSVGAVTFDGSASAAALYEAADAALYRAKHGGRNRVEIGTFGAGDGAVSDPIG